MESFRFGDWVVYTNDGYEFESGKVGKWMCFSNDKDFVSKLCKEAVESGVVAEAKYRDVESCVACFYLNYDDINGHKRVISYFLENNLIKRTEKQRLYNISFKLDEQTASGEYGKDFHSDITLSKFLNLDTGEWII